MINTYNNEANLLGMNFKEDLIRPISIRSASVLSRGKKEFVHIFLYLHRQSMCIFM